MNDHDGGSMMLVCPEDLRERLIDVVITASMTCRSEPVSVAPDATTWRRAMGDVTVVVRLRRGSLSIEANDGERLETNVELGVPNESENGGSRFDGRQAVALLDDVATMLESSIEPEDPLAITMREGLREMAKDMNAAIGHAGRPHHGVRLRCGFRVPARAFVDRKIRTDGMSRLVDEHEGWNEELRRSVHAHAVVRTLDRRSRSVHVDIGGAVIDVHAAEVGPVEILRRLPGIPDGLRSFA
jgi:hypothetical protein